MDVENWLVRVFFCKLLEVHLRGPGQRRESPSLDQDSWKIELLSDPGSPQRARSGNF
jgi:hypothetical protein